jgi:hypothetical protein
MDAQGHYPVQRSSHLAPVLISMNPLAARRHEFDINLILSSHPRVGVLSCFFLSEFLIKILHVFLMSLRRATCIAFHSAWLDYLCNIYWRIRNTKPCKSGFSVRSKRFLQYCVLEQPQCVLERPQNVLERPQRVFLNALGVCTWTPSLCVLERLQCVLEHPEYSWTHPESVLERPQSVFLNALNVFFSTLRVCSWTPSVCSWTPWMCSWTPSVCSWTSSVCILERPQCVLERPQSMYLKALSVYSWTPSVCIIELP